MRGTPATPTDQTGSRVEWDLPALAFSALFAALLLAAAASLIGVTFVFGASLADAVLVPCAGILIGLAADRRRRPGARPILFLTSVVALIVLAVALIWPDFQAYPQLGGAALPAIAAVVAGIAALVAVRMDGGSAPRSSLVRTVRHRAAAVLLIGLVMASIGVQVAADLGVDVNQAPTNLGQYLASVVAIRIGLLAIALLAWWWGTGWLLAVTGLSTVVGVAASAMAGYGLSASAVPAALFGIASLVAGLWPPAPPRPRTAGRPRLVAAPRPIRPTVAAVWAVLGALLLIPTLFFARAIESMGDRFDRCPVPSPLAGLAEALDLPLVVLFLVLALSLALQSSSSGVASRVVPTLGLVAALFVLLQIALGQLGTAPFELMGFAAPATLLLGLGFGAALLPGRSVGAGALVAVATACLVIVWVWSSFVFSYGIAWPLHFSALVEAAVGALALATAFGPVDRAVEARVPEDQPPSTQTT